MPRDPELEELAAFGAALEDLRRQSRISYRSLSMKAGYSSSVLAKAASGRERPTFEVVRAFVIACGGDLRDWIDRWHRMNAAVNRHQQELQAMVDTPYEFMTCPGSPARFNRQLQLRVCRAGKQAAVAVRANYAPSTVSGVFKGTRLANEKFVRRMLAAANAPDDEQAVWLEWRGQLAHKPRPAVPPAEIVAPAPRSRWLRPAICLILAVLIAGAIGGAMGFWLTSSSPGTVRLDGDPRSQPMAANVPTPTTEAPSDGIAHGVAPSPEVTLTEGTTAVARVSNVPKLPRVSPHGVRKWPATLLSSRLTVYVICFTTKTPVVGWYYTDQGEYFSPTMVHFSGDDRKAVPPCNKVSFPEAGMTPMPNDSPYSRNTEEQR